MKNITFAAKFIVFAVLFVVMPFAVLAKGEGGGGVEGGLEFDLYTGVVDDFINPNHFYRIPLNSFPPFPAEMFFYASNPDSFIYGYGYGKVQDNWVTGFGYGYGFTYYAENASNWIGDFRLGYFVGINENSSSASSVLPVNSGVVSLPVDVFVELSDDPRAFVKIGSSGGTVTVTGDSAWDGSLQVTSALSPLSLEGEYSSLANSFDSDQEFIAVQISNNTSSSLSLSDEALIVIEDVTSLDGKSVLLARVNGQVEEVSACTDLQYTGDPEYSKDFMSTNNYNLGNDEDCYNFDSEGSRLIIATRHFTAFGVGVESEPAVSGGGGSSGSKSPSKVAVSENSVEGELDYNQEVAEVLSKGIVTVNPTKETNKCEALTMMSRVFGWSVPTVSSTMFEDVPNWCVSVAEFARQNGIVKGRSATMLGLDGSVSRYEVAVMIHRELVKQKYEFKNGQSIAFSDPIVSWAQEAVTALSKEGIIKGFSDGTFGGEKSILKQDLGVMLLRTSK